MKKNMSLLLAIMLVTVLVLSACGKKEEPAKDGAAGGTKASAPASTVRLGIFKNVTHAPGYVALEQGLFQKYWGENVKIEVTAFDNGSDFSTALATDQIDLGYTGPGPATNQFLKSKNFRIVSGSNNGGAVLVAAKDSGISSPKDLLGKTVAIPTKGSTNEISLRLLLKENNLNVTTDKTGVQIIARAPADTLIAMRQKEIEATLVPEPWGTQMEQEGVGKIIVDWNKIPPNNGDYPLTLLAASDKFLKEHRDMVKQAIKANADAVDFIKKNPDKSYELINNRLKALSGKGMEINLIKAAISRLNLTTDVNKAAIEEMAKVSIDAGYIKDIKKEELDLSKFLDLSLLEEVKAGK
ncbi:MULTISPECIES: ABC transporter substrate-binding protein [Paenibacillus]|uniref:ABC transporter substrate-binding protein n=1 Tax=Paenibacillus radicis (ex Xue et al. 2023) TaxID=2972489 RepID=A0ABT1YLF4_9BACL|nr:ABC transporter substrate-binding protein [Paenibacillus radicis (ex Xue et al. 2023)]MCR8633560.1 ABC transporter substrate-binding protein [Paenibacillus radicis (ex Xue et al. 2023)]